jgi:hypothetical protein
MICHLKIHHDIEDRNGCFDMWPESQMWLENMEIIDILACDVIQWPEEWLENSHGKLSVLCLIRWSCLSSGHRSTEYLLKLRSEDHVIVTNKIWISHRSVAESFGSAGTERLAGHRLSVFLVRRWKDDRAYRSTEYLLKFRSANRRSTSFFGNVFLCIVQTDRLKKIPTDESS